MNTEIFDLGKIGITLGGEYDNQVIYEKLTIVLYKGKSYISTKTVQGVSPEQDILSWQLVAEAKDAYHMLVDAGKTNLTEEEFLVQLEDATKGRYLIQGNLINAADEEDLTTEHSDLLGIDTLKLANRDNTNGMGYVILRKNKSFAEQVTKENTIYEIRYDFTLENNNISIPNNCVLKFNGGSITNGNIVFINTLLLGCIKIGCHVSGTLKNDTISTTFLLPERYVTDAVDAINELLSICKTSNASLYISKGVYIINKLKTTDGAIFNLYDNAKIYGDGIDKTILKLDAEFASKYAYINLFFISLGNNIHIEGISFDVNGRGKAGELSNVNIYRFFLLIHHGNNITVDSCKVYDNNGRQCILLGLNEEVKCVSNVQIKNCIFDTLGNESLGGTNQTDHSAIYINGTNVKIHSNSFINPTDIIGNVKNVCTAIETHCDNVIVSNNYIKNFKAGVNVVAVVSSHINAIYQNNIFENVYMGFDIWQQKDFIMNNIIISNNIIRKALNHFSAINAINIENNIGKISIYNNDISCTIEKLDKDMLYNPAIYINMCKDIDLNISGNNIHDYNAGGIYIRAKDTTEYNINVVICDNIFNNLGLLSNIGVETNNIIISLYFVNGKTIIVDENKCINCLGHITFLKFYQDYFDNMSLANNLTFGLTFINSSFISGKPLTNYIRCYGNTSECSPFHISFNKGSVSYSDTTGTRFNHIGGSYPAAVKTISYTNEIPSKENEHGDIIFYKQPQRNNCIGKVCVTRGNTGIWLPFGKIEPAEVFQGITTQRPILTNDDKGFMYFDTTLFKPTFLKEHNNDTNIETWIESDGAKAGVKRTGKFSDKPVSASIYIGFRYFCTDKQTTEGATNGIEIIHKGNDIWVDALGRVIS